MLYQSDHEVSRLFSFRRFAETLLKADQAERQGAEQIVAEVRRLLEMFLVALPGPSSDDLPPWDDSCQRIVEQWLEVPWFCVRALLHFSSTVKDKVLDQVPKSERKNYRGDLPALVVHWIRSDAKRAWADRRIRELLTRTARAAEHKMSIRLALLLSFVPDRVFAALRVRPGLEDTRHRLAPIRQRWANPRTRLDPDDPWMRDLRPWAPKGTEEELKRMAMEAHSPLQRKSERAIFADLGLDKGVGIADPKQGRFWNAIALPLIAYMEPQIRARKTPTAGRDPITPDAVFRFTSRLLALRSNGRWEDKPGRLKSRRYRAAP